MASADAYVLAMDIGNTNSLIGLYRGSELVAHWRANTEKRWTSDQYAAQLAGLFGLAGAEFRAVQGVAVSLVVPPLHAAIHDLCRRYFEVEPLVVGPGVRTGIAIEVDDPRSVGPDRIANAAAAFERHRQAVVVVDFGTGTNFDVVSGQGAFIGGAIAPGLMVATEALFEAAAALPKIELTAPPSPVGRNTVTNMQAGVVFGFAGLVDGLVGRIQERLGGRTPVVATGGLADVIAGQCATITEVDPLLTLTGLRQIYERNR